MKKRALAIAAGAASTSYWLKVRPWMLRWGATDEETTKRLPGDDLVREEAPLSATRAITIKAPVRDVWPWIAQIGQHRAGFYSYAWLENLAGCHMVNADRIVPEWQVNAPGDKVWLHPKFALQVARVEPGHALVLNDDWAFVLEPVDERTTRLIVRSHGEYKMPDLGLAPLNFVYWRLFFEPAHFIMERAMLLGIKQRAERSASVEGKDMELSAVL